MFDRIRLLLVLWNTVLLSDEMKRDVLDVVKGMLLTPRGLRTLSPKK